MFKHKSDIVKKPTELFNTPESAITPILKHIPSNVKTIWECTNGNGAISNVLIKRGYKVIKSDIDPQSNDCQKLDFLKCEPIECDMIIFNPPFSKKTEFLDRVCKLNKPFMCIVPLTIMETKKRYELFKEHQLSVINLPSRTSYTSKQVWFHSVWITNVYKSMIICN